MDGHTSILLHNALIVTSENISRGSIFIYNGRIENILYPDSEGLVEISGNPLGYDCLPDFFRKQHSGCKVSDIEGRYVMAGGIDAHVHFRDPGLTHKADFGSESAAALFGGVTSVIDMPNTLPPTVSYDTLSDKLHDIAGCSHTNFGLHIGVTNSNADEILRIVDNRELSGKIAGIKVFLGSSTGNMLVNDGRTLEKIFSIRSKPVLVHCEDEATIKANLDAARKRFGDDIPFSMHPEIRSRRACILSSIKALEMAIKYGTRMHLCHISTMEEVEMVRAAKAINPNITAETSVNYLWFSDKDYDRLGSLVKCNPAIKTERDREALIEGVRNGTIDTIGTDHAPHLMEEKSRNYCNAPSGIPSIQHSLPVLLTIAGRYDIPLNTISAAFSSNAAKIFGINERGKIEKGQAADLAIFKTGEFIVEKEDIAYKCGWSPYEGETLSGKVTDVYLGGIKSVENGKIITGAPGGTALECHIKN